MWRCTRSCLLVLVLSGCGQPGGERADVIEGAFPPGSRFALLRPGMSERQVEVLIGRPQDTGARMTGKQFIPLYFGGDQARTITYYRGAGRLEYADQSFAGSAMTLVKIVNDASETGASH